MILYFSLVNSVVPGPCETQPYNDLPQGETVSFASPRPSVFPKAMPKETARSGGGEQNWLFPLGPVIKCFLMPPNSKLGKIAKKSYALRRLAHKFAAVSRSTTWSRASRKFKLLFPQGISDSRQVARFLPIGKLIWVGRYNKISFSRERGIFFGLIHGNNGGL